MVYHAFPRTLFALRLESIMDKVTRKDGFIIELKYTQNQAKRKKSSDHLTIQDQEQVKITGSGLFRDCDAIGYEAQTIIGKLENLEKIL